MKIFMRVIIGILIILGVAMILVGSVKHLATGLIIGVLNILMGFHLWNSEDITELQNRLNKLEKK